jgi:histidyl-tRNA synthetase
MEKEKPAGSKAKFEQPRLVRGMKDTLPSDQAYWDWVRTRVFELARDYSFGHITTPILEQEALFVRSIGATTDIVEKEMFAFSDQGEDKLVMRPEATASIVRAYNEHGMVNLPQPVKLFYYGPMFRRERPQAGRYREFNQYGFEVLGDDQPIVDAQLMVMAYNFFKEIGLPVTLQVNSLGNVASRNRYRKELNEYFKPRRNQLCDDCKKKRRRQYDEANKQTIKGVRDRLKSRLRKHKGIMDPGAVTEEWTLGILNKWQHRCVITGQTLVAKLDVIPFHGFKAGVPVPPHQWVVVTLGQSMKLSHMRNAEKRTAQFPMHIQQEMADIKN